MSRRLTAERKLRIVTDALERCFNARLMQVETHMLTLGRTDVTATTLNDYGRKAFATPQPMTLSLVDVLVSYRAGQWTIERV